MKSPERPAQFDLRVNYRIGLAIRTVAGTLLGGRLPRLPDRATRLEIP